MSTGSQAQVHSPGKENTAGGGEPDAEWAVLAKIPSIIVFGDHLGDIPLTNWTDAFKDCSVYVEKIKALGGDASMLSLPAIGIKGNGHMFMQDDNSLQIADLMLKWIDEHVEKKR